MMMINFSWRYFMRRLLLVVLGFVVLCCGLLWAVTPQLSHYWRNNYGVDVLVRDALDSSSVVRGRVISAVDTVHSRQLFGPVNVVFSSTARDSTTKYLLGLIPAGCSGKIRGLYTACLVEPQTNQDSCYGYLQVIKSGVKRLVARISLDGDSTYLKADTVRFVDSAAIDSFKTNGAGLSAYDFVYFSTWAETTATGGTEIYIWLDMEIVSE